MDLFEVQSKLVTKIKSKLVMEKILNILRRRIQTCYGEEYKLFTKKIPNLLRRGVQTFYEEESKLVLKNSPKLFWSRVQTCYNPVFQLSPNFFWSRVQTFYTEYSPSLFWSRIQTWSWFLSGELCKYLVGRAGGGLVLPLPAGQMSSDHM